MDAFELLIEQIEQGITRHNDNLGRGNAKDYAEYRHTAGTVRGLRIAQDLISGPAKTMEQNDES